MCKRLSYSFWKWLTPSSQSYMFGVHPFNISTKWVDCLDLQTYIDGKQKQKNNAVTISPIIFCLNVEGCVYSHGDAQVFPFRQSHWRQLEHSGCTDTNVAPKLTFVRLHGPNTHCLHLGMCICTGVSFEAEPVSVQPLCPIWHQCPCASPCWWTRSSAGVHFSTLHANED